MGALATTSSPSFIGGGNQSIRKRFATLGAARQEASFVLVKLDNRHNEVLKLEPTDRAIYVQALDLLKPFATGNKPLTLNLAVAEYAEVRRQLPPHIGLKDVLADYLARHRQVREQKAVAELVVEYLAAKEQADVGDRHLRDLRSRLQRFARAFTMPVTHLTSLMIQAYIDALPVANRSKLNDLRHIGSVLRRAVRRKYASRDTLDELAAIERPVAWFNTLPDGADKLITLPAAATTHA